MSAISNVVLDALEKKRDSERIFQGTFHGGVRFLCLCNPTVHSLRRVMLYLRCSTSASIPIHATDSPAPRYPTMLGLQSSRPLTPCPPTLLSTLALPTPLLVPILVPIVVMSCLPQNLGLRFEGDHDDSGLVFAGFKDEALKDDCHDMYPNLRVGCRAIRVGDVDVDFNSHASAMSTLKAAERPVQVRARGRR